MKINIYIKFCEIISFYSQGIERKQNLTSTKGHNSVTNLRKATGNNANLDIVNINAHIKNSDR